MKKFLILIALIIMPGSYILAQVVTVTDADDRNMIFNVAIYNEARNKYCYTNRQGKADISIFSLDETLYFQHFSYEVEKVSYKQLQSDGFSVKLRKKTFIVEEFVVSANRWEQNTSEIPNKISSISRPEIELYSPQSAADLISVTGEVFIQKSQMGGGSPMIRGFATNRVLIVVDGVRMNNIIYREGNIQSVISLDPLTVDRTEVIFGPGAYVYGSDAIGGVMDFHTSRPLLSTGDQPMIRSNLFTRYSSASREKTGHFDLSIGGRKAGFLTSITFSDYDHLKMGSFRHDNLLRREYVVRENGVDIVRANDDPRVQIYSGYKQFNTMNKFRLRLNDNFDMELASHYSRISDVPRYDRLIQYRNGLPRFGAWYYGPQIWMMNSVQVSLSGQTRFYDRIKITAAQQFYRESRHERRFLSSLLSNQEEKVNILSLNLDADKELSEGKSYLFYGLETVRNSVESMAGNIDITTRVESGAASRYPNGDNIYNAFSVYGGYKNNLSSYLTLNSGLRFNYSGLSSTIADNSFFLLPFTSYSLHNRALTGSLGIVIRPDDKMQINANASTGFRAPNLDDTGKIFESAPGVLVVPNPDLTPEYAWNLDIGISRNFGEIIHAELTGYYTILQNALVRRDFEFDGASTILYLGVQSKIEAMVNTGSATVYGMNAELELNITKRFKARSIINLSEGSDQDDIPLRHISPMFGSTHLMYEYGSIKADLYAIYNGSKPYEKMSPSESDKPYLYEADENGNPYSPGWYTLNLKVSYNLFNWGSINAGVENILDRRYRPYSSGIAGPGRNFVISLKATV